MTGWIIGYVIGVVVVVIVVTLATILIRQARRIAFQASDILSALERGKENTAGLWEVDAINRSLRNIAGAAVAARHALTGGSE